MASFSLKNAYFPTFRPFKLKFENVLFALDR